MSQFDIPEKQPEWHAAFPSPNSTPGTITKEELFSLLTTTDRPRDFLLVDLRRNDHYGITIKGSLNLPAQSLWFGLETLYELVKAAGIKRVIWYCRSSNGRGPRGAAWFADYLEARNVTDIQSIVLSGGIKGWIAGGEDYTRLLLGEGNPQEV